MVISKELGEAKRIELVRDGFCVFESILTPEMIATAANASNRLLDAQDREHFER